MRFDAMSASGSLTHACLGHPPRKDRAPCIHNRSPPVLPLIATLVRSTRRDGGDRETHPDPDPPDAARGREMASLTG